MSRDLRSPVSSGVSRALGRSRALALPALFGLACLLWAAVPTHAQEIQVRSVTTDDGTGELSVPVGESLTATVRGQNLHLVRDAAAILGRGAARGVTAELAPVRRGDRAASTVRQVTITAEDDARAAEGYRLRLVGRRGAADVATFQVTPAPAAVRRPARAPRVERAAPAPVPAPEATDAPARPARETRDDRRPVTEPPPPVRETTPARPAPTRHGQMAHRGPIEDLTPLALRAFPSHVEEYAPGRSGPRGFVTYWLPGRASPVQLEYEEIDGLAIVEGDIILGRVEDLRAGEEQTTAGERALGEPLLRVPGEVERGLMVREEEGRSFLWPDAVIPYEIDDALNVTMRNRINTAIGWINDQTDLLLIPRTEQRDYVRFRSVEEGCASSVGRQTGRQNLRLENRCSTGSIAHEILHAAGIWHEQSRGNRDDFVEILWDNIRSDAAGTNFEQRDHIGTDIGAYDYGSIMHYSSTAFGGQDPDNPGQLLVTIRPLTPGAQIGNRDSLSWGDIEGVREVYAPHLWEASEPIRTDAEGGAGGTAFELACNREVGEVLVGIQGNAGPSFLRPRDVVRQIAALCRTVDGEGRWRSVPPPRTTAAVGGEGGSFFRAECPADHAMDGVGGRSRVYATGRYVNSLYITCRELRRGGPLGTVEVHGDVEEIHPIDAMLSPIDWGDDRIGDVEFGPLQCSAESMEPGVLLFGQAGSYIDQIGLGCASPRRQP